MDSGMGLLFREMVRNGIRIDGSVENLGPYLIPREVALTWSCPETLELWSIWEHLALANRVLYRKWNTGIRGREIWQAVVPANMRIEILYQLHDSPLNGGHFAVEKTMSRIKQILVAGAWVKCREIYCEVYPLRREVNRGKKSES